MQSYEELRAEIMADWTASDFETYRRTSTEFRHSINERRSIGSSLCAARKSAGLTQTRLASLSGIDQAEISRLERGLGNPTIDTLTHLGLHLGLRLGFTPAEPTSGQAETSRPTQNP